DWVDDENTTVILVEHKETKVVYGGARLQVVSEKYPLPIELALGKYDAGIMDMVKSDHHLGGTSELCGLWNSREVAGMGIGSYILCRVGASIAAQLAVRSIFVLCAPITVRMGKR